MRRAARVGMLVAVCAAFGGCGDDAGDAAVGDATTLTAAADDAEVADPALREELLAMLERDQAERTASGSASAMAAIDAENQARLAEIFDEHGWPGWSLVGEDGSTAAWAIVQHADLDPDFQQRGLELLTAAVEAGDASRGDLAYLVDRVRVAAGEPQVYGTQWTVDASGEWQPRTPIEDEANVDARRAEAGLGTIAEYLEELQSLEG